MRVRLVVACLGALALGSMVLGDEESDLPAPKSHGAAKTDDARKTNVSRKTRIVPEPLKVLVNLDSESELKTDRLELHDSAAELRVLEQSAAQELEQARHGQNMAETDHS